MISAGLAAVLAFVGLAAGPAQAGAAALGPSSDAAPGGRLDSVFFDPLLDASGRVADLKAQIGFYRPREVPRRVPFLEDGLDAVVTITAGDASCSAVFVSREGHLLTAAHCVRDYLTAAASLRAAELDLREHDADVKLYPENARTNIRISPSPYYAVLVAAGRGFISPRRSPPDVSGLSGRTDLIARLGALASGDWAILKAPLAAPSPCRRARPSRMPQGVALWTAGYPAPNSRPGGLGANGRGLYVTYGEKAGHIDSSEWLATLDPASRSVFQGVYQPGIASGALILSNQDSFHGMSGAPIFNDRGEVVGVTTAGGQKSDRFLENSTLGASLRGIFDALRGSGIDPGIFFNCP
ncbi:MAG: trypsin-like peptidase domain-containing protein [Elusimicrobia bacterium]|nr:trypsin-like peptidase domain-containing protein [Elusimicrobiota bacterium]